MFEKSVHDISTVKNKLFIFALKLINCIVNTISDWIQRLSLRELIYFSKIKILLIRILGYLFFDQIMQPSISSLFLTITLHLLTKHIIQKPFSIIN